MHGLETINTINATAVGGKPAAKSGLYTVLIEQYNSIAWDKDGATRHEFDQLHVVELYPAHYGATNIDRLTGPDWANMAQAEVTDGDRFDHYRLIAVIEEGIVLVDTDIKGDEDEQDS